MKPEGQPVPAFRLSVNQRFFLPYRQLIRFDNVAMIGIDLEGSRVHLDLHVILISRILRYSPRVRTGEASPILELAGIDNFAIRCTDREIWFRRPLTVDVHASALFATLAD